MSPYNVHSAIAEIQSCGFECEAGPLAQSTAFAWLADLAARGPKYAIGQKVFYEVKAKVEGIELSRWCEFEVVAVFMGSSSDRQTYTYHISRDPPRPYHYGGENIQAVAESALHLTAPASTEKPHD